MTGLIGRGRSLLLALLAWFNRISGGRFEVFSQSYRHFIGTGGPFSAASLSYYALFSLFPLALFLIVVVGLMGTGSEMAYIQTISLMRNILPVSVISLFENTLQEALKLRGQISLVGFAGLLWAASGYFSTLITGINRAWPSVKLRNPVQSRLIALAMIGGVLALLGLSLVSSLVIGLLPVLFDDSPLVNSFMHLPLWQMVFRLLPLVFTFLMFLAMYRWLPNKMVSWQSAWRGALFTSLAWEAIRWLFGLYMSSGLAQYDLLYGSLGALAALLVWIYFSNAVTLFGAHLVATIEQRAELASSTETPENTHTPNTEVLVPSDSLSAEKSSAQPGFSLKGPSIDDPLVLQQPVEPDSLEKIQNIS